MRPFLSFLSFFHVPLAIVMSAFRITELLSSIDGFVWYRIYLVLTV